jgi:hypothetical protein
MQIEKSWAIKPFAALASTFEKVIVIDADSVFLQPPENLLSETGWQETGTLPPCLANLFCFEVSSGYTR